MSREEKIKALKSALENYVGNYISFIESPSSVDSVELGVCKQTGLNLNHEFMTACEDLKKGNFYISFFLGFEILTDTMIREVIYKYEKPEWQSEKDFLEQCEWDAKTSPYPEFRNEFLKNKAAYLKLWERMKNGEIWNIVMNAKYNDEGRLIRWFK